VTANATKQLLLSTEEGALAQAQTLLAQVTELHGHVLSVLHPKNRRSLEELWRQIRSVSDMTQKHDTQLLEVDHDIRRLLPLLPAVRDHAQDILTLWVHIRDGMDVIDPDWRTRYAVPPAGRDPAKFVSSIPVTLPTGVELIVARPDARIPFDSYYFAPVVQQLLPSARTPPATPARAAGGGHAQKPDFQNSFSGPVPGDSHDPEPN
jgi:hypothetical protein